MLSMSMRREQVEVHSVSGVPPRHGFVGLQVQLSRGPKLSTTKEVELDPEQRTNGGDVEWGGAKVSMMATLYSSKTGKAFSDKRYRISLIGVRPAAFGTTKTKTREMAQTELNASEWSAAEVPQKHTLQLPVKLRPTEPPILMSVSIGMRCIKAVEEGDEDDEVGSISSAITGFSRPSNSVMSEAVAEQDLDGFNEDGTEDPLVAIAAANAKFGLSCSRKYSCTDSSSPAATPVKAPSPGYPTQERNTSGHFVSTNPFSSMPPLPASTNAVDAVSSATSRLHTASDAGVRATTTGLVANGSSACRSATQRAPAPEAPAKEVIRSHAVSGRKSSEADLPDSRAKEIELLRAELEERRDETVQLRAALAAAEADCIRMRQQAQTTSKRGGKSDTSELANLQAEVVKVGAEKEAAWREVAALQLQLRRAEEETNSIRGELNSLQCQLAEANQTKAATQSTGTQSSTEEYKELSALLVEAKLSAAQYAFERDELLQQGKKLRAEMDRLAGGGKKVSQQLTSIEMKYEELRVKYDTDMRGFIDLKLQAVEAQARIEDLEEQLKAR